MRNRKPPAFIPNQLIDPGQFCGNRLPTAPTNRSRSGGSRYPTAAAPHPTRTAARPQWACPGRALDSTGRRESRTRAPLRSSGQLFPRASNLLERDRQAPGWARASRAPLQLPCAPGPSTTNQSEPPSKPTKAPPHAGQQLRLQRPLAPLLRNRLGHRSLPRSSGTRPNGGIASRPCAEHSVRSGRPALPHSFPKAPQSLGLLLRRLATRFRRRPRGRHPAQVHRQQLEPEIRRLARPTHRVETSPPSSVRSSPTL